MWKGLPAEQLSSARMMEKDPVTVWEWFEYRRGLIKPLKPNPAHLALARWEDRFEEFTLVTQNIDGLHTLAGSKWVLELHGNIWRGRCFRCDDCTSLPETPLPVIPPRCRCEGLLRPDVVLFGELLPEGVFEQASLAAAECDLFFTIGTSAVVYPAASLPMIAKRYGAFVIEVNPEQTDITPLVDATILGKAGEVLPRFG